MDLLSGDPYWLLKHGLINTYPSIDSDVQTEVAVIGAGITGSLMAFYLSNAGFDVVVVDRRHVGLGSTVASTSLLQYEIDMPLHKLANHVGIKKALTSYKLCVDAIDKLLCIADHLGGVEYQRNPSLQFASYKKHVPDLRAEYLMRKEYGISSVDWFDEKDIEHNYGFSSPGGLFSEDAAVIDAYQLTHALLKYSIRKNEVHVWDNSEVTALSRGRSFFELSVKNKFKIKTRYVIICCGYESRQYLPRPMEELRSTYAIISEPMADENLWHRNSLIWETADPYLYLRTTTDNRVLVGGKDDLFHNSKKRDANLSKKRKQLEKAFHKLFSHVTFKTDFCWAGTFCSTKDGLPFIGQVRNLPNMFFTLGFGGNGILFSLIGAEIICELLKEGKSANASLFSFDR